MAKVTAEKLSQVEEILETLSGNRLNGTRSFGVDDVTACSFEEWEEFALSQSDPDAMRNALYYGFQPLYDSLLWGDISCDSRQSAVKALDRLVAASVEYLTSYYMGEPNLPLARKRIKQAGLGLGCLDEWYEIKNRNIDRNEMYPKGIRYFLVRFMEHILDEKIAIPDYIVGCACGASEVAMPLSGMLGVDVGFIRRSRVRQDEDPICILAQEPQIRDRSNGANVVCVEDYVHHGNSLKSIMTHIKTYNPNEVRGASVNCHHGEKSLRIDVDKRKFHLYSLKRPYSKDI